MTARRPRIGIDFSSLDTASPGSGMYRYVVDLARAFGSGHGFDFVLIGSRPSPVTELAELAAGPGWRYVPWRRSSGHGALYRDQARLAALLVRERVQLLHAVHGFVPVVAPCPTVATLYDLMYEVFPDYGDVVRSRSYRLHRWTMRHRARRLIAISQATAADAQRLWRLPPARFDVVPIGTRLSGADGPDAALPGALPAGVPASGHVVLSPFNLEPRKNLGALLDAVAAARARHPGTLLALYGHAAVTPEREAAFTQRVERLGLGPAVIRTGLLDDAQLAALYRRADVFVFPSLYEGFGLPLLEAMGAGACVVARNASSMAEIVGDAGVLLETKDAAALTDAIAALLADPGRRAALGAQARVRAAQMTTAHMAQGTLASYARALA